MGNKHSTQLNDLLRGQVEQLLATMPGKGRVTIVVLGDAQNGKSSLLTGFACGLNKNQKSMVTDVGTGTGRNTVVIRRIVLYVWQ